MANLTKEEIIKRGYLTDVSIANSNVDVDSDLFKAHITDRFVYDTIYGGRKESMVDPIVEVKEEENLITEPIVEPITEEPTVEVKEEDPVEVKDEEPTVEVKDEEDPVEPGTTEDEE